MNRIFNFPDLGQKHYNQSKQSPKIKGIKNYRKM